MRFDRIATDPDDPCSLGLKRGEQVTKLLAFVGSTRGIVLGVKPENEMAAEQVVGPNLRSGLVGQCYLWEALTRCEHAVSFLLCHVACANWSIGTMNRSRSPG